MRHPLSWLLVPALLLTLGFSAHARSLGSSAAKNIMRTAATGSLIGFCAGMTSYGYNNNTTPELVFLDSLYGFVGGAVLGTGLTVVEFTSDRDDIGGKFSGYIAGGAGIGMMMGAFVALIPYAHRDLRDEGDCANFNEGSIGLGLGGLIGGALGLGLAFLDVSLSAPRDEGEERLVRGRLGLQTEDSLRPPVKDDEPVVPALWCRMVEVTF